MESRHVFPARRNRLTRSSADIESLGPWEREVATRLRERAPLGRARGAAQGAAHDGGDFRRGDDDLNPGFLDPEARVKPAAVLVPLIRRSAGLHVLLTRRTPHLSNHAGQICFPGGRIEAWDASAEAAALRETEEEIGLAPASVAVIGELDPYRTRTGYTVSPIVGMADAPGTLSPAPREVAEIFDVPLDFFLRPENRETHQWRVYGQTRYYHVFVYGQYYIWGATAGMLVNLSEVLSA